MAQDNRLAEAVAQCREDEVKTLLREKLAGGVPAPDVLAECNRGMVELGNRFNQGDCFLPDLMFGGMIMKGIMAELEPHLVGTAEPAAKATAVLGTVQYNVHDIGKDIVVMMLRGVGFAVIDLGVNVPAGPLRRGGPQAPAVGPGDQHSADHLLQVGCRHGGGHSGGRVEGQGRDHGRRGRGQRFVEPERRLRFLRPHGRQRHELRLPGGGGGQAVSAVALENILCQAVARASSP